jgi:hypothetical protein
MAPPPGYVANSNLPTQKFRRVKGLSTAISVAVAVAGIGGLLNGIFQSGLRSDAEDLLAGRISENAFNDQLVSSSAFSALSGVATLASMVLVMIWMYRISANLRAFGTTTTWHPLFAIFGWFLPPVVLYVIPFLMLREQWTKSKSSAIAPHTDGKSNNPALWVWWLAFGIWPLLALFLSAGSLTGSFGDTSAEAVAENLLDTNQSVAIVGSVIGLVAAIAWILFVRQLTARHRSLTSEI